jgi:hypothetical protein
MNGIEIDMSTARAVADLAEGQILARGDRSSSGTVIQALTSKEIVGWWVRPGVFNTTEWKGGPRRWPLAIFRNCRKPFEFLEIDSPSKLVHTWHLVADAERARSR